MNALKGHGDSISGLCFSADGRHLATGKSQFFKKNFIMSWVMTWKKSIDFHLLLIKNSRETGPLERGEKVG